MSQEVTLMISAEGLTALADMALTTKDQLKLDELSSRNSEGRISAEELQELDLILKKIDELNLVKARAGAALHQLMIER